MSVITVQTTNPYDITIEQGLLLSPQKIIEQCIKLATNFIIIADENIIELYAEPLQKSFIDRGLNCYVLPFSASEENKSREYKYRIENEMLALNFQRDTCMIAVGGGITTDMAGFVAATYCRGIPIVYIPTSLLAMVDASVGGKTGVNTEYGKNLIGCFKQPDAVFIDPLVLKSLPREIFCDGMAEVIKHALLADHDLAHLLKNKAQLILNLDLKLLSEIIQRNCEIKRDIVIQDETEKGLRQLLNLGHTFAHALEKMTGYSISHGQAVAWGLLFEAKLAVQLNIADQSLADRIKNLLSKFDLLQNAELIVDKKAMLQAFKLDKKNKNDKIHFVFLSDIEKPYTKNDTYSFVVDDVVLEKHLPEKLSDIL